MTSLADDLADEPGVVAAAPAADPEPERPGGTRTRTRRRTRRRMSRKATAAYFTAMFGLIAIFAAIAWLVHLGHAAGAQLAGVRSDVAELRNDAGTISPDKATLLEGDLQNRAGAVRSDTRDPIWRIASHIPDFGNDFKVAAGMAAITDNLAQNVLPPLVDSSHGLRPETLRKPDGSIDLAAVTQIGRATADALPAIAAARTQLAHLQQHVHFNALAYSRAELGTQLADVQTTLATVNTATTLLPPMLGATGPRHYFLVFQNLAEARGTGGLMGTWGELTATNGQLTLDRTGPDTELQNASTVPATVQPSQDWFDTWGDYDPLSNYQVANLSPNFAAAGQVFAEHASAQLGVPFDGVIAMDPVTLGYLLGSSTVTLSDGTVVTGSTVARVTESDLYSKYGESSPVRKQLLADLAADAFKAIRSDSGAALLKALQGSIGTGHLQLWSAHPSEESLLSTTDLGGVLPAATGSFAYVAINNTGPKTDYWLKRSLFYATGACPAKGAADQSRDGEIDLTLTDTVPAGQAAVVAHDELDPTAPYGRGHDLVSVYAPVGALYASATLNGAPVNVSTSIERGHLVMNVDLYEPDGVPQNLAFHFTEPASSRLVTWRPQPMGQPETVVDDVKPC